MKCGIFKKHNTQPSKKSSKLTAKAPKNEVKIVQVYTAL